MIDIPKMFRSELDAFALSGPVLPFSSKSMKSMIESNRYVLIDRLSMNVKNWHHTYTHTFKMPNAIE